MNNENGECNSCEWYVKDRCLRVEKFFSSMTNPICLAKVQCILLRDLVQSLNEYLFEEDEGMDI